MHSSDFAPRSLVFYAGVFIIFLCFVSFFWLGFLGSDDAIYVGGAYGWIEEFPYVGGHGSFRYTITIPIALSFLFFGENHVTVALPSLLYTLILLWILLSRVRRLVNVRAIFIAALLFVTSPLLVIWASVAAVDAIEACFVFASLACFVKAIEEQRKTKLLVAAGVFAALGFLTRETTIFLVIFYSVLFAFSFGIARRKYWIMAISFISTWLLEVIYFFIMTGDPLYRVNISANHDSSIDRSTDLAGNIIVNEIFDPLLLLLANQEFGLLFWVAIPLIGWLFFRGYMNNTERRFAVVFGGLGMTWFLCAGLATTLLPLNPRYFLIVALSTNVLLVLMLDKMFESGKRQRTLAYSLAALVVLGNLAGLYMENRNFNYAFYKLADWAVRFQEPIYTDSDTYRRARYLMRWHGVEKFLQEGVPPERGLYFYNSERNEEVPLATEAWIVIDKGQPQPKLVGSWLLESTLWDNLPDKARDALGSGHEEVVLYRLLSQ